MFSRPYFQVSIKCLSSAIQVPFRYHLHNLKNVKKTHGGVLILVNLQAEACNFTKSSIPPWVFFTFLKLNKCYQIAQSIANRNTFFKNVLTF